MYEYDERTGEGRRLPDNKEQISDLAPAILDVLDTYISPRQKVAKEKIAEEIEIRVLEWLARQELNRQFPPLKLYDPPPPNADSWGE